MSPRVLMCMRPRLGARRSSPLRCRESRLSALPPIPSPSIAECGARQVATTLQATRPPGVHAGVITDTINASADRYNLSSLRGLRQF